MMEERINDNKLKSVPELPIIPAFFTLDVFGSTIIISPEKTWNSGENKNFDFLKSILYVVSLLSIFLISFIYSQNYTYVKPSRDGIGKIYMGREISGIMGHRGAGWLERSSRGYEERPDLVIKALKLGKSDIVADFGAGSGYFTKRLAPLCSLVYAVDIQKEMININKGQMNEAGIKNVLFILGDEKETNLSKESIDYLIMVDVYHELEFPYEIMKDIYSSMKNNGKVVLVEYRKEDPKLMIKPLHKMSVKQVQKEMINSGFEFHKSYEGLQRQHMLFFNKKNN